MVGTGRIRDRVRSLPSPLDDRPVVLQNLCFPLVGQRSSPLCNNGQRKRPTLAHLSIRRISGKFGNAERCIHNQLKGFALHTAYGILDDDVIGASIGGGHPA